nr:HipA domain-containing protein [Hydrogenophaga electricum]
MDRAALAQILRRRVFNVLAVNNDDHTKNFLFLLREGGRWELARAHDITHAYRPDSEWVREHQMSVNGRFVGITRADVRSATLERIRAGGRRCGGRDHNHCGAHG